MENIQTALASQLDVLSHHPEQALATLQQSEAALGALWQQAESAGDENAKALVMQAWEQSQAMAAQNTNLIEVATNTAKLALSTAEQLKATMEEYGDLQDAIETVNEDHPLLRDFAMSVREDEAEYQSESLYHDAMDSAYDAAHDEITESFYEGISEGLGIDWKESYRFLECLRGEYLFTDEERAALKGVILSVHERLSKPVQS
jgi:hypothetical protein